MGRVEDGLPVDVPRAYEGKSIAIIVGLPFL